MKRFLLWGFIATLLSGCISAQVHSRQPLFGAAEAEDAPRLREGIWIVELDDAQERGRCRFSSDAPLRRWPDCAPWVLVRQDAVAIFDPESQAWSAESYRIAQHPTGRMVWQEGPRGAASAGEYPYAYFVFEPLIRDDQGMVTRFTQRGALCGPPNLEATGAPGPVTLAPLEGLTMSSDGQDCLATGADAVWRAVEQGQRTPPPGFTVRWVRTARDADFAPR